MKLKKNVGKIWRTFLQLVFVALMLSGVALVAGFFVRAQDVQDIFRPSATFPGEHAHCWNWYDRNSDDPEPRMTCARKVWPNGITEYCTGMCNHEVGNRKDTPPPGDYDNAWAVEAPFIRRERGQGGRELPTRKQGIQ